MEEVSISLRSEGNCSIPLKRDLSSLSSNCIRLSAGAIFIKSLSRIFQFLSVCCTNDIKIMAETICKSLRNF